MAFDVVKIMTPRGFPQFHDGDVEIYLSADEKLVLHSAILSVHSEWFDASLSDRWATSGASGADKSILGGGTAVARKRSWIYELRFGKHDSNGILMRQGQENVEPSKAPTEMISARREPKPLTEARLECLKAHRNVLDAIYHRTPSLSNQSLEKAKASIRMFMDAAELYGCEDVVRKDIEIHIWHFRTDVLNACAREPVSMLDFALRQKCDWIFMEAATNLLGRSNRFWTSSQARLEELGLYQMLYGKRAVFVHTLMSTEHAIHNSRPDPPQDSWKRLAYCFLHEELAVAFKASRGCGLAPGYAHIYHSIADNSKAGFTACKVGAMAYCKNMNSAAGDHEEEIMQHVEVAFSAARKILEPLLKDATRLQPKVNDKHRALTLWSSKMTSCLGQRSELAAVQNRSFTCQTIELTALSVRLAIKLRADSMMRTTFVAVTYQRSDLRRLDESGNKGLTEELASDMAKVSLRT